MLVQAGNYTRTMGDGKSMFGAASNGYGTARLQNGGALDAFSRYGFGWRQFRLLAAPDAVFAMETGSDATRFIQQWSNFGMKGKIKLLGAQSLTLIAATVVMAAVRLAVEPCCAGCCTPQ